MKETDKFVRHFNRFILGIGIGAAILAVVVAYMVAYDYTHYEGSLSFFRKNDGFENFAGVMTGTAGTLLTLSGVIFLGYTLYQTRLEMSETREILNTQLAESTFFNLVKNHKEIIVDPIREPFNNEISNTENSLSSFFSSMSEQRFLAVGSTEFHPETIYKHTSEFKKLGKSAIHITNHIENSFGKEKQAFYHQTFYYNLSDEEKFLFGMIVENSLEPNINFNFDYSEYYNERSRYKNTQTNGYFPPLKIHALGRFQQIYLPTFRITQDHQDLFDKIDFHIECDDLKLKLIRIDYKVQESNKTSWVNGSFEVDKKTTSFFKMFLDTNLQTYIRTNQSVLIFIEFVFEYLGKNFTVCLLPTLLSVEELSRQMTEHNQDANIIKSRYGIMDVIRLTFSDPEEFKALEDFL